MVIYEHLRSTGDSASFYPSRTTTRENGLFSDLVGPDRLANAHYVITQTFSIGSNSAPVLSTIFSHRILVTNGSVIINFEVLQP